MEMSEGSNGVQRGDSAPSYSGPEGGRKLQQYLGAMAACMFAVCMGTTMGWTSAANRISGEGKLLTDDEYSWMGACMPLGALLAAVPTGPAIRRWGRKNMMLALSPIIFLAWLLIIFANAAWMLLVARLVIGAAIGSISMIAPLYTSEIAHKSVRGTLGGFFQFLHTCGVLFAYFLGYLITGELTWISVICSIVPLVAGFTFFFFPDTPTWYLQQNDWSSAKKSLSRFRGSDYPNELLEAELNEISNEIKKAEDCKKSLREAFTTKQAKLALLLSMTLMVVQQLSGVSAVIFYAGKIFKDAGSSLSAEESAIVMGLCLAGATFVSLFIVDRLGRRFLLLSSGIACIICNVVIGIYMYLLEQDRKSMESYGAIPILTMSVFMILFSIGYGPIPWGYSAEVFEMDIRSAGMSIATLTNWSMVFLVTLCYDPLQRAIHNYATFWIFAAIVLAGTVVVALLLVETNGKSPEEIQEALKNQKACGRRRAASSNTQGAV